MNQPWQDHLEWAQSWHSPALWLALLLGVAVLALTVWNVRPLTSWRRRAVLVGLRALTVAVVVAVVGQPVWVSRNTATPSERLAVVVDRSASMATGGANPSRWSRALKAAEALAGQGQVEWYTLGEGLEAARSAAELGRRVADGQGSDLLGALVGVAAVQRPGPLRGVVLISDGLDNAALRARNPQSATALDADSATVVRGIKAPVHSIFIDDPTPQRDIAVSAVRASSFGFTRTFVPVSVDLEVSGWGDAAPTVTLQLFDNGKPMVSQEVALAGPSRRTVELEFQPLHVGTHVLEAAVVALPEEATDANNRAWTSVRVVRDRTRILHLAGHPSWDGRFLRSHLRANPAVDLVSFYVMVGDGVMAPLGQETTLIPFPAEQLFKESLSGFDLMILQDFPWGPFELANYATELSHYLRGGGALLLLGGPKSLAAGGYAGTPLADLLPVQVQASDDAAVWDDQDVQPVLTPAGQSHPAVQLGRDADDNAAIWASHRWSGRNAALQALQGSAVLVSDKRGEPLLVVGEREAGRSAVVATDSLWMWAFGADQSDSASPPQREAGRGHYHRLLDQLTAWLLRDPDLDLIRLEGPPDAMTAGSAATVRVHIVDGAGKPVAGVGVAWALQPLGNSPSDQAPLQPSAVVTDASGVLRLVVPPQPVGAQLLAVEAEVGGRKHRATLPWVVTAVVAEAAQLQPSDRLLQAVARASGGQVWQGAAPARGIPPAAADPTEVASIDKVHADVWSRPETLVLLVVLLTAEWVLRRRWGLA